MYKKSKDKQNRQALKQAHQEKREMTQINTIRNERGETTRIPPKFKGL